MMFAVAFFAFFGTLAIGQSKHMDTEFHQNIKYVFNYGISEKEYTKPVENLDKSELTQFCENEGDVDGIQRTLKILENYDDDPRNFYFTCLIADDTDYVQIPASTEDAHEEPATHTLNIPTETTESEKREQDKPAVLDPECHQEFYYIFDFEYVDRSTNITLVPVKRMADLKPFCQNREFWNGEKRKVNIIELNGDPRKVYFTCVVADDDDVDPTEPAVPPTPKYTRNKPTTSTENTDTQTTAPVYPDSKLISKGYEYHPSADAWMKVYYEPERWGDARLRCLHEGSTLASPLDPQMLKVMKGLLGKNVSVAFTGISADYAPGYFYSVEGVSLDEIPADFAPGTPDITQSSDGCIGMYPNGTLTMLRYYDRKPFICYVKASHTSEIKSCGSDPDYVYERRTGKCYKFHTYGRTWSSAFMTCATEGGHLAIINSDKEAEAVVDLVNKFPESAERAEYPGNILLGFRDWSEHRTWMTIHGQTLPNAGYSRWGAREPNDLGGEYCGAMFRDGELNDTLCGSALAFVCEKKPVDSPKETSSTTDSSYRL